MREIHRAVDRIHDPAIFRIGIAGVTFLAEQGYLRERVIQFFLDQFLAADIEFEFDVVRGDFIRLFLGGKVFAHDRTGGLGGFHGGLFCIFQIHERRDASRGSWSRVLSCERSALSWNGAVSFGERARLGRCESRPRGSLLRLKLSRDLVSSHATGVRREAHRTAAEAAAVPKNSASSAFQRL